jgi:hypothetical protein
MTSKGNHGKKFVSIKVPLSQSFKVRMEEYSEDSLRKIGLKNKAASCFILKIAKHGFFLLIMQSNLK